MTEIDDPFVQRHQTFVIGNTSFIDKKAVVGKRLNFKIIVKFRYRLYFRLRLVFEYCRKKPPASQAEPIISPSRFASS